MGRKRKIFCVICIVLAVCVCNLPKPPRLISSITTFDTAYLTILVNKFQARNTDKLEAIILQMCREDAFENIKLQTEDRTMAHKFYISVYTSKKDLEKGTPFLTIRNDAGN